MTASRRSAPARPRTRSPGVRAATGFTLLEVMVALAILSMSLMAVSDVVSNALRNSVRARTLDVATLLARGKLAELEDHYEAEGFQEADESEEGTFEEDGHPEVRWKVDVVAPETQAGGLDLCQQLVGDFAQDAEEPADGAPVAAATPQALAMGTFVQQQCATLAADIRKGVRELRLEVSWPEGKRIESFTVTTHLVVLQPRGTNP